MSRKTSSLLGLFVVATTLVACAAPVEPDKSPVAEPLNPIQRLRQGHTSILKSSSFAPTAVEIPPPALFEIHRYPTANGDLPAYVSVSPDKTKRPAIIWIGGGDLNSIGDVWSPRDPSDDQSAAAYREAGMVMMFPSLRGGNENPGVREGWLGEVDDVLAAAAYLASLDNVDPQRIYLGGHSTGGTLVLLVASYPNIFQAVFAFGAVEEPSGYGERFCPFDITDVEEVAMRSPILVLNYIKTPTFILEGEDGNSNVEALRYMEASTKNPQLTFGSVFGTGHFDILAPLNRFFADQIVNQTSEGIHLTKADLDDFRSKKVARDRRWLEEGISLCRESKDGVPCLRTGAILLQGDSTLEPDPKRGEELLKLSCDREVVQACALLGLWNDEGPNPNRDPILMLKFHQRACELGDDESCGSWASAAVRSGDVEKATKQLEASCDSGSVPACHQLGSLYSDRSIHDPPDLARALASFDKACAKGHGRACHRAGLIWAMGELGKDDAKAAAYFIEACENGAVPACGDAGNRLMSGWGVAKDRRRGRELVEHGCAEGSMHACGLLAEFYHRGLYDTQIDLNKAAHLLSRVCNAGGARKCVELVGLLRKADPDDLSEELRTVDIPGLLKHAAGVLKSGCHEEHHGRSCRTLAELRQKGDVETPGGDGETQKLIELACKYDQRECAKP